MARENDRQRLDEALLADATAAIAEGDMDTANELLKAARKIQAAAEKNVKHEKPQRT